MRRVLRILHRDAFLFDKSALTLNRITLGENFLLRKLRLKLLLPLNRLLGFLFKLLKF